MTDFAELRGDDVAYQTYRQVAPIILPDANGMFGTAICSVTGPTIYKFKIVCGCGLYTTDTLDDWDSHLAELVAADDGSDRSGRSFKLHTDRVSVQMVRISE